MIIGGADEVFQRQFIIGDFQSVIMLIVAGYEYDLGCADTPWILSLPVNTIYG